MPGRTQRGTGSWRHLERISLVVCSSLVPTPRLPTDYTRSRIGTRLCSPMPSGLWQMSEIDVPVTEFRDVIACTELSVSEPARYSVPGLC